MKKKLLIVLTVIAAALCFALGFTACGPKRVEGTAGLEYTLSDDGEYYYFSGLGTCTETEIVIANYYNGKPVKRIGKYEIAISEDLYSLGLESEEELKDLCVLADGHVTSVTISEGITAIGTLAFLGNFQDSLESISLPKSLKTICFGAFDACEKLESVTLPDGVTTIGDWAFWGCYGLTSIKIPNGVTTIGDYAFAFCRELTDVTIPDGVTSIGARAFVGCASLESVTIPVSINYIGDYAFNNCNGLTNFTYSGTKEQWYRVDATNWNSYFDYCEVSCTNGEAEKQPVKHGGSEGLEYTLSQDGNYYILSGLGTCTQNNIYIASWYDNRYVTEIGAGAFRDCTELESVDISDSIKSIGASAFNGCVSLESVTVPDSVENMGGRIFMGCTNLKYVELGNGITKLDTYTFQGCEKLESVTIPESVKEIGFGVFTCCYELKNITIPDGVTKIDGFTFAGCNKLESITIPDGVTEIGTSAFSHCFKLKDIVFAGTKEQWNAIKKGPDWNFNTGNYTIHCTDGDIKK